MDMRKHHNKILIDGFQSLGVEIEESGRNDLLCKERKFSGSAYEISLAGNKC